ncbi:MAG: DUF1428 family protein, partial [Pseudomonadota bacterium]
PPPAVRCEPDETVVIGFVAWPSKLAHEEGMPTVMKEMQGQVKIGAMDMRPFDGKPMILGRGAKRGWTFERVAGKLTRVRLAISHRLVRG